MKSIPTFSVVPLLLLSGSLGGPNEVFAANLSSEAMDIESL